MCLVTGLSDCLGSLVLMMFFFFEKRSAFLSVEGLNRNHDEDGAPSSDLDPVG